MSKQDFAAFLRAQRRLRKLSQSALARQVQVSERTLRNWETGDSSPGRWELESLLTALKLTPSERTQALALVATPRGMQLSRQEVLTDPTNTDAVGPLPSLGDLLRAMRQRCGLSQDQMAGHLRIARTSILRWETAQSLPSEENRERICALLNAYPEERIALSSLRMQFWGGGAPLSIDACARQVEELDRDGGFLASPLIDLRALALKRQLWLLAQQSSEAVRLLARVQVIHAAWLILHERKAEAAEALQRSLQTLQGGSASEPFWQSVLNLAALTANDTGGNEASIRVIKRWLPHFSQEYQAPLWCDLGLYAARAQQSQEVSGYLTEARRVLPHSWNEAGMIEHYYPLTCSRLLLTTGRPLEAMDWLPAIPAETEPATSRASYRMLWAEAFVEAREWDAAQRHLDHLDRLFTQYPQPFFHRKFQNLSARL